MIVLYLYRKITGNDTAVLDRQITHVKNIVGMFVCLAVLIQACFYHRTHNNLHLEIANHVVVTFMCLDLPFSYLDSTLHHLMVVVMFYMINCVNTGNIDHINEAMMWTEVSSVWLIVRHEINTYRTHEADSPILQVSDYASTIVFTVTFYYYRIHRFAQEVIYNESLYLQFADKPHEKALLISLVYAFYALNVYWFALIVKKWTKQLLSLFEYLKDHGNLHAEWAMQYTFAMMYMAALWIVLPLKLDCFLDMAALYMIALSSYEYHGAVYRHLRAIYPSTELDTISDTLMPLYQSNVLSILLLGLCNTLTLFRFWECGKSLTFYYYPTNGWIEVPKGQLLFCISVLYGWAIYDVTDRRTRLTLKCTEINAYHSLPLIVTLVLSAIQSKSYTLGAKLLVALYMTGLIRILNVGYEYNHLLFHACIFTMIVYTCKLTLMNRV